jgi:hypothetical protein
MQHFTPVDTLDTSNFLRAVAQPDGSVIERFLMPVTGFSENGQAVTPEGFGTAYGLFLTVDATILGGVFKTLDVTLWADPHKNDGTPSVSQDSDPAFSNGMTNDIVLATGTLVSASVQPPDASGTRHADFVESMTPTLAGTLLLHGSIQQGAHMQEQLTTPSSAFSTSTDPTTGVTTNLVTNGSGEVTLDPQGTILLPNIPHSVLQLADFPRFIHGHGDHR